MNVIVNERFTMESFACHCEIDLVHEDNGSKRETLRIRAIPEKKLLFAYVPGEGLVTLNPTSGAVDQTNILGKFAGIDCDDKKSLIAFFSSFGFLYPISHDRLESFSFEDIFAIQKRVRITLDLMGMLQAPRIPYMKIMSAVCWLTLADRIEIYATDGEKKFGTCPHTYKDFLLSQAHGKYDSLAVDPYCQNEIEVPDTIYPPSTTVSMTDFEQCAMQKIESEMPILNRYAASIIYINEGGQNESDRFIIDYFYHLTQEFGDIISIGSVPSELHFAESGKFTSDNFTTSLRNATLDIAKIIIKEELDYAINMIFPSYDIKTMSASWRIPDLYSAFFFSIFYMRPDLELYRKCANPNCSLYFLVSTTNSRRKYCSTSCSNVMQQRKSRIKKKKASAFEADAVEQGS